MAKLWIIAISLFLWGCGFLRCDDCEKFRLTERKVRVQKLKKYRIGILGEDASQTFQIRIKDAFTNGQTNVQSPQADFVNRNGEVFTFKLNTGSLRSLRRDKNNAPCKYTFVELIVRFTQESDPEPEIIELIVGDNFQCTVPIVQKECLQLNESCDSYKMVKVNSPDLQTGVISLPVTDLKHWDITIGFDSAVQAFRLLDKARYLSNQCNQIFLHRKQIGSKRGKNLVMQYEMRVQRGIPKPEITYISYGNSQCKAICGSLPICPGLQTTPAVVTTTDTPPIEVTTEAPPEITTEAPPEVVTTVAPPEVVTTESPPEVVTTAAPPEVVTTEAPPEVVTTEAPPDVVTTEEPPESDMEETWHDSFDTADEYDDAMWEGMDDSF